MKAITTKYLGPTDTKGARIRAHDGDGNAVTVPCRGASTSEQNHAAAARALADKMGWDGWLLGGSTKNGMAWVFADTTYRA